MPISVICDNNSCRKSLKIKDEFAGKIVECPRCGGNIRVPDYHLQQQFLEAEENIASRVVEERLGAVLALKKLGDPFGLPLIYDRVADPAPVVADEALLALLEGKEAARPFLARFFQEEHDAVRRLMKVADKRRSAEALDFICTLVEENKLSEQYVSEMVPLFARIQNRRALPTLEAIRRRYPNLEQLVQAAIGRLEHPESGVATLYKGVRPLEKLGKLGCLPVLLALLAGGVALLVR
ncbi:MAG: hypothetical protein HY719_17630 [Planctomycetes bacterium]|nr:hypothetical protein [Planctomycetota bacterium]